MGDNGKLISRLTHKELDKLDVPRSFGNKKLTVQERRSIYSPRQGRKNPMWKGVQGGR